ncbi:MAG: HNH endonuclease, partial [Brevibacterium sp.]|nr:HNH endonuclease [Brevibacterium sp.]
MDTKRSGDRPDEEEPVTGAASSGGQDPLTAVTDRLAAFDGSPEARVALAEILAVMLQAFTTTTSVRDPLPSTAPGTAEEALAVLGGLEQLTSSVAAIDAIWQVRAERRIR